MTFILVKNQRCLQIFIKEDQKIYFFQIYSLYHALIQENTVKESQNKDQIIAESRETCQELEIKCATLEEDNRQLLSEKQSKDLRLAELKMKLEQAQYVHKEKVSQTVNESFELREENSSLWQDVERLNEALERRTEEQEGFYIFFDF